MSAQTHFVCVSLKTVPLQIRSLADQTLQGIVIFPSQYNSFTLSIQADTFRPDGNSRRTEVVREMYKRYRPTRRFVGNTDLLGSPTTPSGSSWAPHTTTFRECKDYLIILLIFHTPPVLGSLL